MPTRRWWLSRTQPRSLRWAMTLTGVCLGDLIAGFFFPRADPFLPALITALMALPFWLFYLLRRAKNGTGGPGTSAGASGCR